jgi:hypothetical protein
MVLSSAQADLLALLVLLTDASIQMDALNDILT